MVQILTLEPVEFVTSWQWVIPVGQVWPVAPQGNTHRLNVLVPEPKVSHLAWMVLPEASFAVPQVAELQSLVQYPVSSLVNKQVTPVLQPLVAMGLPQASA